MSIFPNKLFGCGCNKKTPDSEKCTVCHGRGKVPSCFKMRSVDYRRCLSCSGTGLKSKQVENQIRISAL